MEPELSLISCIHSHEIDRKIAALHKINASPTGMDLLGRSTEMQMPGPFDYLTLTALIECKVCALLSSWKKCGDGVAPNYCFWWGNIAAIVEIRED
uniref:Uncharacterized protein n=1 Tax=Brassica campestris TaxID=3711 RepID=M4D1U9_BRACM